MTYVYNEFKLIFFIVPFIVSTAIASLIAHLISIRIQLSQSQEQFRAVADIAEEFIYYRNLDGSYKYVSPSCEQLTGYPPDTFYSTPSFMNTIIHEQDREVWMEHVHQINQFCETETLDVRIVTQAGDIKWMRHICATVTDKDGTHIGVRSSNIDITEQKKHEEQIFNIAYYDPLTNLPNRRLLEEKLDSMITSSKDSGDVFSVMFLVEFFRSLRCSIIYDFLKISINFCLYRKRVFLIRFKSEAFSIIQ